MVRQVAPLQVAESQFRRLFFAACILAIYTAPVFNAAPSGSSVEDLIGVFSIQKTIKLGSSSECFAGSQNTENPMSLQNNGLADDQPPGLAGFGVEPKSVDASSSHSINLTAHITDDQSGFARGWGANLSKAWFVSPSGRQVMGAALGPGNLSSGNRLDGIYRGLMVLPKDSETGTWSLDNVTIFDLQGNRRIIGRDQMLRLGFPTEFLVT